MKHLLEPFVLRYPSLMVLCAFLGASAEASELDRAAQTKLRVASYNVYWGSVFPPDDGQPPLPEGRKSIDDRREQFLRVHSAVSPDIWALQEVLYGDEQRRTKTVAGIRRYFSEATGEEWHVAADERGRLVLSRYPIVWSEEIVTRVFAVLVDVPPSVADRDVLLLNVHFGGGWGESMRSARTAARFLRRVERGEVGEVPRDVTTILCGDFNSKSDGQPYRVVRSLDPDVPQKGDLDWLMEDVHPRHLDFDSDATIGAVEFDGDERSVVGRRIDFFLYRSDHLHSTNQFIFNTLVLDDERLSRHGLRRNDTAVDPNDKLEGTVGFDHLPLVVDFAANSAGEKDDPAP